MNRIRRGWALTKKSWGVLRGHPELIRFPLYGGVATILMAIVVVGPGLYLIDDGKPAPGAPLVIVGLYLLALVGTYFSVGLAACADMIFHGREASYADGAAVARSRFGKIAGWALPTISLQVGAVLGVAVGVLVAALDALFDSLVELKRVLPSLSAAALPVAVSGAVVYIVGRVLVG